MNTQEFFDLVLPSQGHKALITQINGQMRHRWYEDHALMAVDADQMAQIGRTVYFSCASYQRDAEGNFRRRAENVLAARSFWLDLDVGPGKGYSKKSEAGQHLLNVCDAAGLPFPTMIDSGYGVHAYFPVGRDMAPAQWKLIAAMFKQELEQLGVKADPTRTADIASILRPVGTVNLKNGASKPVRVMYESPVAGKQFLQGVLAQSTKMNLQPIQQAAAKPVSSLNGALGNIYPVVPVEAEKVALRCRAMAWTREHSAECSEPLWYASLGVLKHCVDADTHAQEWSRGHPDYNAARTSQKLQHAIDSGTGPTTCAKFRELNPVGCEGCTEQVTSPLQLGKTMPAQATAPVAGIDIIQPGYPYLITEDGRIVYDLGDGEPEEVYHRVVMMTKRSLDLSTNTWKYTITHWVEPVAETPGHWNSFELGAHLVADVKALRSEFARHDIQGFPVKKIASYVEQMAKTLATQMESSKVYSRMGWHGQDFVGPGDLYKQDGSMMPLSFMSDGQIHFSKMIVKRGTVEGWADAVAPLATSAPHAVGVLMGFVAPMVKLTGMRGFLVNLYGGTGSGKSTVQKAIVSMYADHSYLRQRGDTLTSLDSFAGFFSAYPIVLEEVTMFREDQMQSFVYSATEGRARQRADQRGDLRTDVPEWDTCWILSANRTLTDMISDKHSGVMTAVQARVFELELGYRGDLDAFTFRGIHQGMAENTGVVGEAWIRYVVQHQERLREEIFAVVDTLTREWVGTDPANQAQARYWLVACAAAIVAAKHTRHLKLFSADPTEITRFLQKRFATVTEEAAGSLVTEQERLAEFLEEMKPYTIVVQKCVGKHELALRGINTGQNGIFVRAEVNSRGDLLEVRINRAKLLGWLREKGMGASAMRHWLVESGLMTSAKAGSTRMMTVNTKGADTSVVASYNLTGNHPFFRDLVLIEPESLNDEVSEEAHA